MKPPALLLQAAEMTPISQHPLALPHVGKQRSMRWGSQQQVPSLPSIFASPPPPPSAAVSSCTRGGKASCFPWRRQQSVLTLWGLQGCLAHSMGLTEAVLSGGGLAGSSWLHPPSPMGMERKWEESGGLERPDDSLLVRGNSMQWTIGRVVLMTCDPVSPVLSQD